MTKPLPVGPIALLSASSRLRHYLMSTFVFLTGTVPNVLTEQEVADVLQVDYEQEALYSGSTDPLQEDSFDISITETVSSNPSAPVASPPSPARIVDFTIHVNDVAGNASSVIVAIIEGKLLSTELVEKEGSIEAAVAKEMRDMLPQVVQQAQFVFHQNEHQKELKEIVAFLFVNSYCRTLRFKRNGVPKLVDLNDIPGHGYALPEGSRKSMESFSERSTRKELYNILGKDGNYDPRFKAAFDRVVHLARKLKMTPRNGAS